MNLRGMKCLDSLWQQLWGIKCGKCGDSVRHQMPFKMTACPRHGGHSHEDWRIPVGFRSRQKGVSHPEEMGKERSVNTIFFCMSLLSPFHSVRKQCGFWGFHSGMRESFCPVPAEKGTTRCLHPLPGAECWECTHTRIQNIPILGHTRSQYQAAGGSSLQPCTPEPAW